jgi:hypothetical protein
MNSPSPEWRRHYEAALREFDPLELGTLISTAETAMHFRAQELDAGSNERQDIEAARSVLDAMKRNILNAPGT